MFSGFLLYHLPSLELIAFVRYEYIIHLYVWIFIYNNHRTFSQGKGPWHRFTKAFFWQPVKVELCFLPLIFTAEHILVIFIVSVFIVIIILFYYELCKHVNQLFFTFIIQNVRNETSKIVFFYPFLLFLLRKRMTFIVNIEWMCEQISYHQIVSNVRLWNRTCFQYYSLQNIIKGELYCAY